MHRIRLILVIAALTAVLAGPMAQARGLDSPRPGARAESSWLTTAMSWLEELMGWRRPAPRSGAPATTSSKGGTCIDPQGLPPLCLG